MKLHLKRKEGKEGLIFKKTVHELYVKIEMSPEEQAAYKEVEKEIKSHIVAEYDLDGMELNLTIGLLVHSSKNPGDDGFRMYFSGRHEIPPKEEEIKRGIAGFSSHLKNVMAGGGTGEEVIEF